MRNRKTGPVSKSIRSGILCLAGLAIGSAVSAGEPPVTGLGPLRVGENQKNHQRILIGPMEPGNDIGSGGWRMKDFVVKTAEDTQPKVGRSALVFGANAEIAGAKGDFSVHGRLPGKTEVLALWVYLEENANIDKLGIQVYDAEGEALMMLIPATPSVGSGSSFLPAATMYSRPIRSPTRTV